MRSFGLVAECLSAGILGQPAARAADNRADGGPLDLELAAKENGGTLFSDTRRFIVE